MSVCYTLDEGLAAFKHAKQKGVLKVLVRVAVLSLYAHQLMTCSRLTAFQQRATKAGLVCRNADGDIVPVYPTNEAKLRSAYTST